MEVAEILALSRDSELLLWAREGDRRRVGEGAGLHGAGELALGQSCHSTAVSTLLGTGSEPEAGAEKQTTRWV